MAHYNVFVQDSSPLFIYSPPGAWSDTPSRLNDSPSLSYHITDVQNATVKLDFVGTGVRVFSATVPTPGSYEVYIDGQSLSDWTDSSSQDSQLLLGSISGLEMAPHTVSLVKLGVTGDILDLDRVEVESVLTDGSSSLSTATFDDTVDGIQWGPGWLSAPGTAFYDSTIHYTEQPDTIMSFSFEGDAIAIYGTSGTEMGYYVVTLDGQSETMNGGSDGSVRIHHDGTILYLANGLNAGRHELTITANPSSLGDPQVFNVDRIKVFSGSSSGPPVLLPPGPFDTGTSSTLPPPLSTGSTYSSVISSSVFSTPTPLPSTVSSTLPPSLMSSLSTTSPTLTPTSAFDNSSLPDHVLQAASNAGGFKVSTGKWVTSSAILAAVIAGIGLIFFALFLWTRKNLDPPSYIDLEKANKLDEKGRVIESGEQTPELPMQPAEMGCPEMEKTLFMEGAPYTKSKLRESLSGEMRTHSRNGSNASSVTMRESAYESYWDTLQKRAQSTSSVALTDSTYRGSLSDCSSKHPITRNRGGSFRSTLSAHSDPSRYSQMSERIYIDDVRMPPQFSTPARPPSTASPPRSRPVSPPRPPRVRESLALPF